MNRLGKLRNDFCSIQIVMFPRKCDSDNYYREGDLKKNKPSNIGHLNGWRREEM